jgi:hypothetical protein
MTFELVVENVAPTVGAVIVPLQPIDIGDQASFSVDVTFGDPAGPYDEPYECAFDLDFDGETFAPDETAGGVTGTSCSTPLNYTYPGVYSVMVVVTDKDGGVGSGGTTDYIVVYDPDGGFATGGGWIYSPEGACQLADCQSATGRASFGFVSRYRKGAAVPTGQTQFQFRAGGLNFRSDAYDWLIVAGATARYKGVGSINGDGEYMFMLTALDADVNDSDSHETDRFRIKIWYVDASGAEVVVYDNAVDAPDNFDDETLLETTTELGGGSIVIHK